MSSEYEERTCWYRRDGFNRIVCRFCKEIQESDDYNYEHEGPKCTKFCIKETHSDSGWIYATACIPCFEKRYTILSLIEYPEDPYPYYHLTIVKNIPQNTKTKNARNVFIDSEQLSQT